MIETIIETKKTSYTSTKYLLSAIIMIVIGSLIFSNPSVVVKFISYVLAILSAIYGLVKIKDYFKMDKVNNEIRYMQLASGIIFIIIAILLVIFSSAIEVIIRITMGIWILFSGINQLVLVIPAIKSKKGFLIPLIFSIVLILVGLYMIMFSNLVFSAIGLVLLIYGILKIVMYIYYCQKSPDKKIKKASNSKVKTVKSKNIKSAPKKNSKNKTK